jgi:hypothetical protein
MGSALTLGKAARQGALWSFVFAFPAAALLVALFRFPVPFAGYMSGFNAIPAALLAVIFYGIFGGFIVLGTLGAAAGMLAYRLHQPDAQSVRRWTLGLAAVAAVLCAAVLAILDKLIGPW